MVSPSRRRPRSNATWGKASQQVGSRESVTGGHRAMLWKVEGMEDEAKCEVLKTCAIAWCKGSLRGLDLTVELNRVGFHGCSVMRIAGATLLLMFSNEEDMRAILARPDLTQWFMKVEVWEPDIHMGSQSAWLSVVWVPMHLWSEETFRRIVHLWGKLIRLEEATTEPQSFDQENVRIVAWDEWVGMVDRNAGSQSEHIDVMQCLLPDMEDKALDIPVLNLNNLDNSAIISTVLTYTKSDSVPVPINAVPELVENVQVVVWKAVTRKVRSVNDLILVTGSEEQRVMIEKARGKNRRNKKKIVSGFGECCKTVRGAGYASKIGFRYSVFTRVEVGGGYSIIGCEPMAGGRL
ncbi:hypothetical protein V6N13_020029 [Hibiscus sabdariffa]